MQPTRNIAVHHDTCTVDTRRLCCSPRLSVPISRPTQHDHARPHTQHRAMPRSHARSTATTTSRPAHLARRARRYCPGRPANLALRAPSISFLAPPAPAGRTTHPRTTSHAHHALLARQGRGVPGRVGLAGRNASACGWNGRLGPPECRGDRSCGPVLARVPLARSRVGPRRTRFTTRHAHRPGRDTCQRLFKA